MNKNRFDPLFYSCPGAWYGCAPNDRFTGNITVDVRQVAAALKRIARVRSYVVVGTRPSREQGGIIIDIAVREAATN